MKPLTAAESRLLDRLERGLGLRALAGPLVGIVGGIVFALLMMRGAGASARFTLGDQSPAYAALEAAVGAMPAFVLLCAAVFGALGVLLAALIVIRLSTLRRRLRYRRNVAGVQPAGAGSWAWPKWGDGSVARTTPMEAGRPLWRCDTCGREFANRNQSHACGSYSLADHLGGMNPEVRQVFDAVMAAVRSTGTVRVLPQKTRIAFQARMSFAQVTPRRRWLDGHMVLARRLDNPRFTRVETFSPRNHLHAFRLRTAADVDDEFREWLAEAYEVGQQRHLGGA